MTNLFGNANPRRPLGFDAKRCNSPSNSNSNPNSSSTSTSTSTGRSLSHDSDQLKPNDKQLRHKMELEQAELKVQLQRELINCITTLAPLDEIRILLAQGAKVDGALTLGLQPIHYATYRNFIDAVKLLTARGCDINAPDDNGTTAVHLAAERGYYELLEFLIQSGAKICWSDVRKRGDYANVADEPLSLALKRNHLDCAELLLKHGAEPNTKYFIGYQINLVNVLNVSAMRLLLSFGANPNARDRSGLTPLMKAARHPQGLRSVELLLEFGADVDDIANERHDYRTVLHHSIFSGNLDIVKLLLINGAHYPRTELADKPSPMVIAIISGRQDLVRLLVEFDADVNGGSCSTIGQPLHTALTLRIDHKLAIVSLLLESGADPNSPQTSNRGTGPPLHDYLYAAASHDDLSGGPELPPPPRSNRISQQPHPPHLLSSGAKRRLFGPEVDLVRLLLRFGAQVHLTSASGLLTVLRRVQDELELDVLHLLLEVADHIEWAPTAKLVYSCLRNAHRVACNLLLDPSDAQDATPDTLRSYLEAWNTCEPIRDDLLRLLGGDCRSASSKTCGKFAITSLKQKSSSAIRRHLVEHKGLMGRKLVEAIESLPLPANLIDHLLYK